MPTAHSALSPDQVRRKSLISGTVGAIIEWYEYTVYGTLSPDQNVFHEFVTSSTQHKE